MSVTAVPVTPPASSTRLWLWLGLVIAIVAAFGLAWTSTRAAVAAKGTDEQFLAWNKGQSGVKTTASGLQYQIITPGEGATPQEGDVATVQLEGRLRNGTIFQPRTGGPVPIQEGSMIKGFMEAIRLMKKGSKYRVWLPANLAYEGTAQGAPDELKGKILIFDIELTNLMTAAEVQMRQMQQQQQQQQMQQQMQAQGAGNAADPAKAPEAEAPKK